MSHVQILLETVVWSRKYSNVNVDYSNIYSDCIIHCFGPLFDITECTIQIPSWKPQARPCPGSTETLQCPLTPSCIYSGHCSVAYLGKPTGYLVPSPPPPPPVNQNSQENLFQLERTLKQSPTKLFLAAASTCCLTGFLLGQVKLHSTRSWFLDQFIMIYQKEFHSIFSKFVQKIHVVFHVC